MLIKNPKKFIKDAGFIQDDKNKDYFYLKINNVKLTAIILHKHLFVLSEERDNKIIFETAKDEEMMEILERYNLLNDKNRKMIGG